MSLPPSYIRVRTTGGGRKRRNLRLPMILIWPLAAALWAALLPLILLVTLLCGRFRRAKALLMLGPQAFGLYCALRGLHVHVEEAGGEVLVDIV